MASRIKKNERCAISTGRRPVLNGLERHSPTGESIGRIKSDTNPHSGAGCAAKASPGGGVSISITRIFRSMTRSSVIS